MFNSSNDRTGLCTFIFEDGRHCNMPHTQGDLRLCFFHEQREVRRRFAVDAGAKIGRYLATNLHTACDFNNAFATLFRAGVQGHLDSKMVSSLTRLGHLLVKTHLLAKEEYLAAYENEWSDIVVQSTAFRPDPDPPATPSPTPAAPNSGAHNSGADAINSNNQAASPNATVEIQLEEPSMDVSFSKIPAPDPLPPDKPAEEISDESAAPDPVPEEDLEEDDTEEKEGLQTETLVSATDDPKDPLPPDTGSHTIHTQPTYRQLMRYLRYLQGHNGNNQPT